MASSKRTITRDSVFRNSGTTRGDTIEQGVAEPESPTRQTAVWLADAEIDWLDSRCQEIKRAGWRNVTRSAYIRALIRAAMEASPDTVGVTGEQELIQRLVLKG